MKEVIDHFSSYLRRKGLKMTEQRRQIIEAFFGTNGHVSVEELYLKAKEINASIGFSTVYRTLKLLKEAGFARQVDFDQRAKFEKWLKDKKHHDHLICAECGKIVEFLEPTIERMQDEIAKRFGFVLLSHRMELFGVCRSCRRKKGS